MNFELGVKITGKVVKGMGYGKVLGFPTANLDRRDYVLKKIKVRLGIWSGIAAILPPRRKRPSPPKLGGERRKIYQAAIVIGPLDKNNLPKIEAHLIGFKGNLYGKKVELVLKKYLRPFKKFKNVEDLKKQILSDIKQINLISN